MRIHIDHQYIKTNDITLHAAVAGVDGGKLVILLHGFPEFWYGWNHQIDFLANSGYHVIVPDQRGYNLSDKPKKVSDYNLDVLTADIVGLIEKFGQKGAIIIGHDWGGVVAWRLATQYETILEKLVIINMPHPLIMRKSLRKNRIQRRKSRYVFFYQLPWLPEWKLSKDNYRYLTRALTASSKKGTFNDEDLKHYLESWSQPQALTSMINWYRAALRSKLRPAKSNQISVPTLLIWGAQDIFLGRELAQPSIDFCVNGQLSFVDNATHWIHHEQPELVNDLILNFLQDSN